MNLENDNVILQNLKDADCSDEFAKEFFELKKRGCVKMLVQMLYRHKNQLLNSLHCFQKKIDCLDYLIFQIDSGPGQKNKQFMNQQ